jgi:hypothetical protein
MRNKIVLLVIVNLFFISHSFAQTADSILARYFDAVGIRNLDTVKTIIINGKITGGSLRGAAVDYLVKKVRPYKFYMELKNKGESSQTIFDGRTEWTIIKGKTVKNVFDVEEQRKRKVAFEGDLFYCKNNNYKIEYAGIAKIQGLDFHLIKVTGKDGFAAEYYFDPGSVMLMKSVEAGVETYYGDFKTVAGVVFPFSTRVVPMATGIGTELNLDSIEFNKAVDDKIFER